MGSVDFLIKNNELLFCEANSNAGYQLFYQLGINIDEKIFLYFKNMIN